jgi:hypothetical protein
VQTATAIDPLLLAEDVWAHVLPSASHVRDDRGDVVLLEHRGSGRATGAACRVRFEAAATDARIADVRFWMAARGHATFTWWLGASTTPDDFESRLRTRGARPGPALPVLTPMALGDEPPPTPAGVEVRVITSTDEDRAASARALVRAGDLGMASTWSDWAAEWGLPRSDGWFRFVAWVECEIAAWALIQSLDAGPPFMWALGGIPAASGASALQALVRAGWDTAVGLGAPGLVTCVPARWQPVLERIGFRSGPAIHVVRDCVGSPRSAGPALSRPELEVET